MKIENQLVLFKLAKLFKNYDNIGITLKKYLDITAGKVQASMDEIDTMYDVLTKAVHLSEIEAEEFMEEWLPNNEQPSRQDGIESTNTKINVPKHSGFTSSLKVKQSEQEYREQPTSYAIPELKHEIKSNEPTPPNTYAMPDLSGWKKEPLPDTSLTETSLRKRNVRKADKYAELKDELATIITFEDNDQLIGLYQEYANKKDSYAIQLIQEKLIEINEHMVMKKAIFYHKRNPFIALTVEDLFIIGLSGGSNGHGGLIKAMERFDLSKGFRFSTYAYWWIKQSITRAIADEGSLIRIPVHMHEQITKYNKVKKELLNLQENPTYEELASKLEVSPEKIAEYESILNRFSILVDYDMPLTESDDSKLSDVATFYNLDGSSAPDLFEETALREDHTKLIEEMKCELSERQIDVLSLRFGLKDGKQHTLEEVGQAMGVTRERIRQIEAKGLRKLRARSEHSDKWHYNFQEK